MSVRTWLQKSGATPGKLALVGCLTVVLAYVLWSQHSSEVVQLVESENPHRLQPPQQSISAKVAQEVDVKNKKKPDMRGQNKWPSMTIGEVVAIDPFGMPAWYLAQFVETPTDANDSSANEVQDIGLLVKEQTNIVMISNGNRIATIGDESYRVGDTIDGFQVTEINRDGVILTEID